MYLKRVFESIFEYKNILKSNEEVKKEKTFEMPSFIGKTITEAAALASSLNLQYLIQGDGDYVTNQIVAPGTEAKENDIILLIFE